MLDTMIGKIIIGLAILIIASLQYLYWFGESGKIQNQELNHQIQLQEAKNQEMQEQNRILAMDVYDLKNGKEAIEERARLDLGLIKSNETFVQTSVMEDKSLIFVPKASQETNAK